VGGEDGDEAGDEPGAETADLFVATPVIDTMADTVADAGRHGGPPAEEGAGSARPGSRADAVLAPALVPTMASLDASQTLAWIGGDEMLRRFEALQEQLQRATDEQMAALASSIAVTGGLSVGYVLWLVRGGVLMSSMLSALPAWQLIDPLPVLAASGKKRRERTDDDVERLFDEPAADPARSLPRTPSTGLSAWPAERHAAAGQPATPAHDSVDRTARSSAPAPAPLPEETTG
jgi:hypothetical protein